MLSFLFLFLVQCEELEKHKRESTDFSAQNNNTLFARVSRQNDTTPREWTQQQQR